jgi:hypothetical protein
MPDYANLCYFKAYSFALWYAKSGLKCAVAAYLELKEQDFWFIQERAKYLGLSISANQRIKIEIFANDKYKERHGSLPK